jgi:D-arabinose 1-dehydrogenase-like Zn-dependent alcohol dehydrogenase
MRALVLEQPGRPSTLSVRDVPAPVPSPGEALVEVAACGFCHHDLLVMAGVLRRGVKPQVVLGHEIAGVVAQLGEGVTTLEVGDHVVSLLTNACGRCDRCRQGREHRCRQGVGIGHGRDGGFAEYVAVAESSLVAIPKSLDLTGAALLACPLGVVLQAMQQVAQLRSEETVLVTGAGGGLGVHAVQVGAALGGRVLAVTSSPEKASALAQLGAAEVVEVRASPPTPSPSAMERGPGGEALDFSEVVLALTQDRGADVIIDTVGSPLFPSTWRSLAQYGRLVLLGEVAGSPVEAPLAELIYRDARILASSGVSRGLVHQAAGLVSLGRVRPVVSRVLPLEEAATALELVSSGRVLGRVVLTAR